jgi:hypothetical protein
VLHIFRVTYRLWRQWEDTSYFTHTFVNVCKHRHSYGCTLRPCVTIGNRAAAMATYQFPVFATEMLTAQLERIYGNDLNYAAVLKGPCWQNLQPLWERIIAHTFSITR